MRNYVNKKDGELIVNIFVVIVVISVLFLILRQTPLHETTMKKAETVSMPRSEQLALLPGEGPAISVPTKEYLAYLSNICENNITDLGQPKCRWQIGEFQKARNEITVMVNPIYGRLPFIKHQLRYLHMTEDRIEWLLSGFEYWFIETKRT